MSGLVLSTDPLSAAQEPSLSVGLNSGIKGSDFARKQLNLVVVLDVSGSMGSSFDSYYCDQNGNQVQNTEDAGKSKIAIATESIVAMMGHLQAGDRFGVVLSKGRVRAPDPLQSVTLQRWAAGVASAQRETRSAIHGTSAGGDAAIWLVHCSSVSRWKLVVIVSW